MAACICGMLASTTVKGFAAALVCPWSAAATITKPIKEAHGFIRYWSIVAPHGVLFGLYRRLRGCKEHDNSVHWFREQS